MDSPLKPQPEPEELGSDALHDLDSQDNGQSTERDPTAIEPQEWDLDQWEDEGGFTPPTSANRVRGLPRAPRPPYTQARVHEGFTQHPTPLSELVHSLGLGEWDGDTVLGEGLRLADQLVRDPLTDNRPSFREFPSSRSIRESKEFVPEGWNVFSNIRMPAEEDFEGDWPDDVGCRTYAEKVNELNPHLRLTYGWTRPKGQGQWGAHAWNVSPEGQIVDDYYSRHPSFNLTEDQLEYHHPRNDEEEDKAYYGEPHTAGTPDGTGVGVPFTKPNVHSCPKCGGAWEPTWDGSDVACKSCGYSIPYDGWEILEGHGPNTMGEFANQVYGPNQWDPVSQGYGPRRFGTPNGNPLAGTPVQIHEHQTRVMTPDDWVYDLATFLKRRPMIYDGKDIHMGNLGSTHSDLGAALRGKGLPDMGVMGWTGPNPDALNRDWKAPGGEYGWEKEVPSHVNHAVETQLGMVPREKQTWQQVFSTNWENVWPTSIKVKPEVREVDRYRPETEPQLHDWRHLENEYPDEAHHGTDDHPYFWNLNTNEIHLGPKDWFHDALAEEMQKGGHGHPFNDSNEKWDQRPWAMGRTMNYRALHSPVFDTLEKHGVPILNQNSWEDAFGKIGKETFPQRQRNWEQLSAQYPDTSKPIHQTPEGWTINHLRTYGDASRVGTMMRNCWQGHNSYSDQSREFDRMGRYHRDSLNDEHGHPQVAFFLDHGAGPQNLDTEVQEALGPRNKRPHPAHEQAIMNWAAQQGYGYKEADYENPLLDIQGGDEDFDEMAEADQFGHKFDAKASGVDSMATEDFDNLTEEQEMEMRDIRDPHANFDWNEPIRKVQVPEGYKEHRERDDMESEDWKFESEDAPVIFNGQRFYQGPPNSYHWDMFKHEPDLQKNVDMNQFMDVAPMKAMDEHAKQGWAYGRFNPSTEAVTWYTRGRYHPAKFQELQDKVYGSPYDESSEMGFSSPEEHWVNLFHSATSPHSLVWSPGWPGKGMYHDGELTTWGVSGNDRFSAWPHHPLMFQQRYPDQDFKTALANGTMMFTIDPEGKVTPTHPFEGEWPQEIHQIDPRLIQQKKSWEDVFNVGS